MTYVVGVDPGSSSGLVALHDGVRCALYQGKPPGMLVMLESLLKRAQREDEHIVIACERFVLVGPTGHTHQPIAQQVIGQVHALADAYACDVVMQSPGDAKKMVTNDLLDRLGLFVRRADVNQRDANDANDASRHAVLLLGTRFATVLERLLSTQPRDDDDVP